MQIGAVLLLSTCLIDWNTEISCYLHASDIIIDDGCFVIFIELNYIRTTKQFSILQHLMTDEIHTHSQSTCFDKCARFRVFTFEPNFACGRQMR